MRCDHYIVGVGFGFTLTTWGIVVDQMIAPEEGHSFVPHVEEALPEGHSKMMMARPIESATGKTTSTNSDPSWEDIKFNDLLECYPQQGPWLVSKRIEIEHSWRKNQKILASVDEDLNEISKLSNMLQEGLDWTIKYSQDRNVASELRTEKLLRFSEKQLTFFEEVKLLELGGAGPFLSNVKLMALIHRRHQKSAFIPQWLEQFPPEIFALISRKYCKSLGDSFLGNMARFFNYSTLQHTEYMSEIGIDYMFKLVDFFFKNGFTTENGLRSICTEPQMAQTLASYTALEFKEKLDRKIYLGLTYLTEHWYWKLFIKNSFMKVLSHEESHYINALFMLSKIKRLGKSRRESKQGSSATQKILANLSSTEEIIGQLKTSIKASGKNKTSNKKEISAHSEDLKLQVENLLKLFQIQIFPIEPNTVNYSERGLAFAICELLSLIDREFAPGIITEALKFSSMNIQSFENHYKLISLSSKVSQLNDWALSYYDSIKNGHGNTNDILSDISNFRKYENTIIDLFTELELTFSKVMSSTHSLQSWIVNQTQVYNLLANKKNILIKLSKISQLLSREEFRFSHN